MSSNNCCSSVEVTMDAVVGKWKPVILYQLMSQGTLRFNELRRAIPKITQKMLTSQLRELEEHKLVSRKVYAQVPPKVEYALTEYGKTIIPILNMMQEWGAEHTSYIKKDQLITK